MRNVRLVSSEERAISSTNEEGAKNIVYIFNASQAGYAHLTKKQFSQPADADLVSEHCLQNLKFIEDSKDLIPLNQGALITAGEGSITGPSFSLPYTMGTFTVNRDFVYGLKCSFWPSQGEEWVHRKRECCWPSTQHRNGFHNISPGLSHRTRWVTQQRFERFRVEIFVFCS